MHCIVVTNSFVDFVTEYPTSVQWDRPFLCSLAMGLINSLEFFKSPTVMRFRGIKPLQRTRWVEDRTWCTSGSSIVLFYIDKSSFSAEAI